MSNDVMKKCLQAGGNQKFTRSSRGLVPPTDKEKTTAEPGYLPRLLVQEAATSEWI